MATSFSDSQPPPISVSQLNRTTRQLLSEHFLGIRVEGEISNLSRPASGHLYFSLKDDKAQVRCAMFKGKRRGLKFKIENGMQVVVSAQVSLYEPRGDYQLIINNMEESGDGALQRAFEQLKQKLQDEGLFATQHKQTIPTLPRKIGIITSPSGAALHDIKTVLKRRFTAIPLIIYPVQVQGDKASIDIANALSIANQRNEVDVLILARGGGSLEDLWCFNEENVARAIFSSTLPVISGIGHEVDFTIADFVADLRAATPSAAAEHAVPVQQEWLEQLEFMEKQLQLLLRQRFQQQHKLLDWLQHRLNQLHPDQQLQRNSQRLDELDKRLQRSWQSRLLIYNNQLQKTHSLLLKHSPDSRLKHWQQHVSFHEQRLQQCITNKLHTLQHQQQSMAQTLHAISPLATLQRGYAIITPINTPNVIKSSDQLQIDDFTETRLGNGSIISQVKEIKHDK